MSGESALLPGHARELAESVINADVIEARGYETLYGGDGDEARLKELRIPRWAWREGTAFPGLLMPMYRVTGEEIGYQFKPAIPQEAPNNKLQKYASQTGVPNRLDVPPTVADSVRDPSEPLWITEGIKKGDCLASLGKAVITLTGVFNWRSKHGTLGDWEDIPLQGRTVVICFDSDANQKRPVMAAMERLGRWLESKGAGAIRYLIVPESVNETAVKGVDDFFHAGGTLEQLGHAAMAELPRDAKDATFTDRGLADTVCSDELDGRYRWASGLGWMQWTGKVWREATEVSVTETISRWALEQFQRTLDQQAAEPSRDMRGAIDGWRSLLSAGRVASVLKFCKGTLECLAEDFDADPDLLNCPNGIVDLRTGVITPSDPDMLMTKITGSDYVKGARHPDWDKALEALPPESAAWLQLRIGQAITGHMTSDDVAVISQGGGANGKSTVADGLAAAVGKGRLGYHVVVADRAMLGGASDNHPTEMMDFMGARYAVLEETPESRRLDTNRLKKLVGTPQISARRIRQDSVVFNATHSLFVNSNYEPVVEETDHGTWRRLALLIYPYTYRDSAEELRSPNDRLGDPTLRDRIPNSPRTLEAVLAWAAEGARRWYELGRIFPRHPEQVRADTLTWRMRSDSILAFISEELEFDRDSFVASSELRDVFNQKVRERGGKEWGDRTFSARFGGHDEVTRHSVEYGVRKRSAALSTRTLTSAKGSTVRAWSGIKFKDPNQPPSGVSGIGDNSGNDPFTGPEQDQVTPVTPGSVTSIETPTREFNFPGVTGVTRSSAGPDDQARTEPGREPSAASEAPSAEPVPAPSAVPVPIKETEMQTPPSDPFSDPLWDPFAEPGEPATPAPSAPGRPRYVPWTGSVGFDLETADAGEAFTYGPGFIRICGVINEAGETRTDLTPGELVEQIEAATTVYGHNIAGFDGPALAYYHGLDWEMFAAKMVDTEIRARLADPPRGRQTGHTLDHYDLDHTAAKFGLPGKTDDVKALKRRHGGYDKIPLDDPDYHAYLVGDLVASKGVHEVFQPQLSEYEAREHRLASLAGRMTLNGFKVNEPLLRERIREGEERKAAALTELNERFGIPVTRSVGRGRGKARVFTQEPVKSPLATTEGKAALVKAVQEATGQAHYPRTPTTGDIAAGQEGMAKIKSLFGDRPDVADLCDLVTTVTTIRTVYQTAANFLAPDGRVHPKVSMRQSSGRWSVVEPGMTVFGKHNGRHVERAIFDESDDGLVIITCDMSQVDMRAIAGHCQDPAYMALFEPGRDAHTEIGNMVGVPRQDAKAIGHGWNYGLGGKKMIADGKDPAVVWAFISGMEEQFPILMRWREGIRDQGSRGELLDNGFGRMMRCEPAHAYTVAPALMGQGGARDLMCSALLRLPDSMRPYLRTMVHDEIVMAVPEHLAEEIKGEVKERFETTWRGVPILADTTGPCQDWGAASAK